MYGLTDFTIQQINQVFEQFASIEQVIIYGSRAKGNYRTGSDIDITLLGNDLSLQLLASLDSMLDDLLLPYSFDISIFEHIENPELVEHINRAGKIFYVRNKF